MSALVDRLVAAAQPTTPSAKDTFLDLLPALEKLWPLWLLVAGIGVFRFAGWLITERRLARSGIDEIDRMDGFTFERRLASLFRHLGYSVEQTRARGDYGADLVVRRDGRKTVVQAKRWNKNVGVKAVQEAVAAKAMYGCDGALVVTNRRFTQQAQKLARANAVRLWGRDELVDALLKTTRTEGDASALAPAGLRSPTPRTEPACSPSPVGRRAPTKSRQLRTRPPSRQHTALGAGSPCQTAFATSASPTRRGSGASSTAFETSVASRGGSPQWLLRGSTTFYTPVLRAP